MARFFSSEWVDAWREAINASAAFHGSGASWDDSVAFVLAACPARESDDDRAVYLELRGGQCSEARLAAPHELADASFVIAADAATWRKLLAGTLDVLLAVMLGKLALRRGSLASLTPHAAAGRALLAALRQVPTEPPP